MIDPILIEIKSTSNVSIIDYGSPRSNHTHDSNQTVEKMNNIKHILISRRKIT